ncbi:DUF433 domain-containing protein [Pseudanabaena sp. ABRG5-3]|uniref:DUF433 domain-containing protein n=1 Tax=Pseudanabaena sp. ABRG5-3 TaxID=685565 RepID=UPI000DC6E062|nr:DUF433 domain-containing protein [Pseudanabaena sp. ABRG5-3]BBC24682.1 hypothetical protein ABRG53_2425 [Pseudanabaena sp. ABRG5-3]
MLLEDYFDFLRPDDIRLKGHRIGIQDVIKYYLSGYSPEEILEELPSLNLEKIYAVITYYWRNRAVYVPPRAVTGTTLSRMVKKRTFRINYKTAIA